MAGVRQYETDVAIVGAGGAGVAAGIEARDAGARAIAFEKAAELGGAAIISGGGCLIVGSPLQKQNGIDDTPDLAFKDWIDVGRPVGRRGLGPLLHRAHAARSLSLGRGPRREVGRPESPGGQLRAALDPRRAQRARPDDPADRGLPQARAARSLPETEITGLKVEDGRVTGLRRPRRQDRRAGRGAAARPWW